MNIYLIGFMGVGKSTVAKELSKKLDCKLIDTDEEIELLQDVIDKYGIIPNQVTDVYKNRRGKYTNVRIWSSVDLGTCRKQDLFITTPNFQCVQGFTPMGFVFDLENSKEILDYIKKLNSKEEEQVKIEENKEIKIQEKDEVDDIPPWEEKNKNEDLFGDLID